MTSPTSTTVILSASWSASSMYWEVVQPPDQLGVLAAGEVRVDRRVLPSQADDRSEPGRVANDVVSGHLGSPAVGPQKRGKDPNRRGLPRAVRAEDRQDRRRHRGQVDPLQRLDSAEPLDEALRDDGGTIPGQNPPSVRIAPAYT